MSALDSRDPTIPSDELLRVVRRPWRIAFIVYATVLTVATHWPKLQLPEQAPATDKSLHLIAFGLGTWLLWRTAWTRALWLVLLIAFVWGAVDEITQMIPGLNRWVGWPDFLANACGVGVAGAWIWAMQPIGGHANRRRQTRFQHILDAICATPAVIATAIGLAILHMGVGAAAWVSAAPSVTRATIIVLIITLPASMIGLIALHWKRVAQYVERNRPCFVCRRLHRGMWSFGVRHRCADCGCMLDEDQWSPGKMREADRPAARRLQILIAVASAMVGVLCIMLVLPDVAAMAGLAALLAPGTFGSMVAMTVVLIALAGGVWWARRRLASIHDRFLRCRHCGQDLRGIITTGTGVGKCPECQTLFRMRDF